MKNLIKTTLAAALALGVTTSAYAADKVTLQLK